MISPRLVGVLGLLCSIGPASIDLYLPAFAAIAAEFGLPPAAIHRTLGCYMLAYACILPLHGGLADSYGRRPVILVALGLYLAASLWCAGASDFDSLLLGRMLQGAAAGACSVVAPAMLQDCRANDASASTSAQRAMSALILMLNLSPALAPVMGGYLTESLGWRANFVALASIAILALALCRRHLPETLPAAARHPFNIRLLLRNYAGLASQRRIMTLCLAGAWPVAGQGLIIGSAPDLLLHVLRWQTTDFGYLFMPMVAGAMVGALVAGRVGQQSVVLLAYGCMACGATALTVTGGDAPLTIILPLAAYVCGLAMATPPITLRLLACAPHHCGTAASLSGVIQLLLFALASGWLAPLLGTRPIWLGMALLTCSAMSALAWRVSDPNREARGE